MPISTISPSLVGDNSIADASKQPAGEGIGHTMNWHEYFTYDPLMGNLIWKERPLEHFPKGPHWKRVNVWAMCNTKNAGKPVSCNNGNRSVNRTEGDLYRCAVQLKILGKKYYVHRIIWEMMVGPVPDGKYIDHIDGDNSNNRLTNLRLATRKENARNRRMRLDHNHGVKGVSRTKHGTWIAQITVDGMRRYLGCFKTKGMAAVAYAKAALRYHGQFARFT